MPTSQSQQGEEPKSEMKMMPEEPQERPEMPAVLIEAAIQEGNRRFLVKCLGLPADEEPDHLQVQIDAPEPTLGQTHIDGPQSPQEHIEIQANIRSATKSGNTILHLLVIHKQNNFALQVCRKDMSLLKAQNKRLETPLHCAAKVGNEDIVLELNNLDPIIVKEVLGKTDDNGDTALHVAVKHGNTEVACVLMDLGPGVAYKAKSELSSLLNIAIANGCTEMAKAMLERDATLACIEDSDGMFPVHLVARMGNLDLLKHFIEEYSNYAELLDFRGRNAFHIAAEENYYDIFGMSYNKQGVVVRMINALDYDGNTPLHIAGMKGHILIMRIIWAKEMHRDAPEVKNKQGLTPLELYSKHLKETGREENMAIIYMIDQYIVDNGTDFTKHLFNFVLESPDKNIWDRFQVVGLGAVLITTVAFAAAFTIPGGYNQENGTPVLGRRYIFRAFILANALAFVTAFMSLFALISTSFELISISMLTPSFATVQFATFFFLISSSCMVVAFGLGTYVTLAPTNMDLAILILVLTVFMGSPFGHTLIMKGQNFLKFILGRSIAFYFNYCSFYILPFLWIFCLAFL